MIVPGHGRFCDTADLAYYRDMVTIIRDRIQDDIKKWHVARAGEGLQTHAGLGPQVRRHHRLLDH